MKSFSCAKYTGIHNIVQLYMYMALLDKFVLPVDDFVVMIKSNFTSYSKLLIRLGMTFNMVMLLW